MFLLKLFHAFLLFEGHFCMSSGSPLPTKVFLQEKIFVGLESFLYFLTQVNQRVIQQQRYKLAFISGMQYVNINFDQIIKRGVSGTLILSFQSFFTFAGY